MIITSPDICGQSPAWIEAMLHDLDTDPGKIQEWVTIGTS